MKEFRLIVEITVIVIALTVAELATVCLLPLSVYGRMNGLHVLTLLGVFGQAFVRFGSWLKDAQPRIGMQFFALVLLPGFYFGVGAVFLSSYRLRKTAGNGSARFRRRIEIGGWLCYTGRQEDYRRY